jgi:hypothetical protein
MQTKQTKTKSLLLICSTLVVGFALGLFVDASLGRMRRNGDNRRPPGFVDRMEEVIGPHSDAQRDSIAPVLEQFTHENEQIVRDANDRRHARLDSLRAALAPLLDAAQRDRVSHEIDRMPPFGAGRGGRGLGGGPPPDGPPPPNDH